MSNCIHEWLASIEDTTSEVFKLQNNEQARERIGPKRSDYERSIREVRNTAGFEAAGELAAWIESEIRSYERFPPGRRVRTHGALICRRYGETLSDENWFEP